jgi:hypothetical protein
MKIGRIIEMDEPTTSKFFVAFENPDEYLELTSLDDIDARLLEHGAYLPEQDWRHVPPVDPMGLSYHGGWKACKTLVKGTKKNQYAGLIYSTDSSLIPPLAQEDIEKLEKILARWKKEDR